MTQEEKDLLLKDLCARQMSDLKVNTPKGIFTIDYIRNTHIYMKEMYETYESKLKFHVFPIESCQPYLRPLSSMTEEEKREYSKFMWPYQDVDFFNEHHLDYRGLIDRGLALEAKEGMYEFE